MNSIFIIPLLKNADDSLTNKKNEFLCKRNKNRYTTRQAIKLAGEAIPNACDPMVKDRLTTELQQRRERERKCSRYTRFARYSNTEGEIKKEKLLEYF
jgi:hypothetical protein